MGAHGGGVFPGELKHTTRYAVLFSLAWDEEDGDPHV